MRTHDPRPTREQEALDEMARTRVSRSVAAALAAFLVLAIAVVPLAQATRDLLPRLVRFARGAAAAARLVLIGRPLAGNAAVRVDMHALEDGLEKESVVGRRVLPYAQEMLTRVLGVGNEQAYVGRDGWLFYRPEIEHLTGPGFLDAAQLERRRRGGEASEAPPQPDPLAAVLDFARQLRARNIELVVLPVPVKPAIEPGRFAPRAAGARLRLAGTTLANSSLRAFHDALQADGVRMLEPSELLVAAESAAHEPQYLATDTHWTPAAMERCAAALAAVVAERLGTRLPGPPAAAPAPAPPPARAFTGRGDLAAMIELPAGRSPFPPERVRVLPVDGWRPERAARVLLLGDSFSNVYSVAEMGFGAYAGLAERLSVHLGLPVDRIARNAGGAFATREELARELERGEDRLAGKRIVVWEFSARELSHGDWKLVHLPEAAAATAEATPDATAPTPTPDTAPSSATRASAPPAPGATSTGATPAAARAPLRATIRSVARIPGAGETPYRDVLVALRASGDEVTARTGKPDVVVYAWAIRDGIRQRAAELRTGESVRLALRPWAEVAAELESIQRVELADDDAFSLDAYWGEVLP